MRLLESWGRHPGPAAHTREENQALLIHLLLAEPGPCGQASDAGRHSDMSKGGATELTSPSGLGFSPESQDKGLQWKGNDGGNGTVPGQQGQTAYPESQARNKRGGWS